MFSKVILMAAALLLPGFTPFAQGQTHDAHKSHAPKKRAAPKARKATRRRAAPKAARYTCPMHPDIVSTKPGTCPKCGMKLRLAKAEAPAAAPATAPLVAGGGGGAAAAPSPQRIPDTSVVDQDGRPLKFYTDLVKGKTVAINFIFTTCTTICPPLGATFARVQRDLGERAGRDVHFISVSVDPATDTPERLKAWGAKFKAGPNWTFVTGAKPEMDELLRALAASSARPEDHSPSVLILNDPKGTSTRAYGLASPSQLIKVIDDAIAGVNTATTAAKP